MVNGDANENGIKINRSNEQKTKNIWTCSTLFCLSLPLFCATTMPFCTTKTSNFLFTRYFLEELSYVLTKDFVSSVMFAFIFSLPPIFTWLLAFLIFSPLL